LATQFYDNTAPRKSYYIGCSLGGRQGIKAAEQFPSDFDGVIAGAPALDFNHLVSWRARFFTVTGSPDSADFISAETWSGLIHDEVLRQCDALDGVVDGIIEDPEKCRFRAELLLCRDDGERPTTREVCLTQRQVDIVNTIYSPFYAENGHLIYPAMQPGSEIMAVQRLYAGMPFPYSEVYYPLFGL
jgi:feruloyl esterase